MNLDEAICHAEEVAEENYGKATAYLSDTRVYEYEEQKCLKCADEHMQLAEWLKDYKRLLEQEPSVSENPNNCEMRDATLEERESIDKYIKSISKPTGVKFGALKQEPSGDLISREAVLENAFAIYTHECGLVEVVGVATIKDLPSVKPQEPTGHWYRISSHDTYYGLTDFKCSKCGEEISKEGDWLYEYCPRCGSPMMVEPQESEEV